MRKDEEIKEKVKEAYSARWSSTDRCFQPQEAEDSASCSCCNVSRQDAASPEVAHRLLMEELAPKDGMKVLDVGSGSGETVLGIAEKVAATGRAVGLDFSEEAVSLAMENMRKAGLEAIAEFRVGEAESLPFEDGTFDAVISECVVCLVPDKQRVLEEKVRVLKHGGRVIMHDVVSRAEMPEVLRNDPTLYCQCIGGAVEIVDEYKLMMERAGLKDIKVIDCTRGVGTKLNSLIISAAVRLESDDQFGQVVDFVRKGGVGYALFVGTKP
jgi:SAM-dependent methyltransferase